MIRLLRLPLSALVFVSSALTVAAHGGAEHAQIPVADNNADWATKHMTEEHHMTAFDAASFFHLHDYDNMGVWSAPDIRRTYGLADESSSHISELKKQGVVDVVLEMFDADHSGTISVEEFVKAWDTGKRLPDFGFGPGHHGDDEYEYEIHHWEKYHGGDDVKEEDLNHPEDIEHFRKHEEEDRRREEWESVERRGVVERNIPVKFRRN